ncbi:MAG: DUF3987 domain-containing protein [Deltaproteobacteria bacterium]|nr:DUF3987 domain-containing protein [Deltaproteobacteria bacterium]MBL7217182.1 DUF3987 domain-containing protein [Desulfobacteraceae bacterium]
MSNLSVDTADVKRFFNALWPGQEDGFLSISSDGPSGLSSKFFSHPLKLDLLCNAIERWSARNVWFTVGLIGQRPDKGRGKVEDVTGIPGLVSDIDCLGGTHTETHLPTKEQALKLLSEIPFKPSLLIGSGGGYQGYWLFSQPWIFENQDEREQAKALSRRWQAFILSRAKEHGWKLDNCGSIEHLFRIPGTFNMKAEPVPVEIVEKNGFRYSVESLEEFLDDIPDHSQQEKQSAGSDVGKGSGRIWDIVEKCSFLRHCRNDVASLPEPDWWSMVCSLCFEGGSGVVVHELSKNYPKYDVRETNKKILEALKQTGPMTCKVIRRKTGFECPGGGCGIKCPVHILNGQRIERDDPAKQDDHLFEWEDPVLLDDFSLPEMEPLPGILGEFSQAVSAATETPLELAQGLALAAVATACQGKVEVQVKRGYSEPVNAWVNVALESGNRKSSVHAEITHPLLTWEAMKREEMEQEIREAESQRKNQEARLKSLRARYGKAKREDLEELEEEIRELESELVEVPVMPKVWVQDITPEHLGTVMSLHGGRMSIMSAEGGIFDIMGGRYSKNGVPNLDLFLQSHSGDAVRVDRGSRESIYLEHPALSMGLSPQPEVLKSIADAPGFRGRGLLARNLYLLPVSKLGHRSLETEPVQSIIKEKYESIIHALLSLEPSLDERGKPVPHVISLSYAAYEEWLEFSRWVEKDLREGERFEYIMDWAGKLPGAAARLAGLLHCVRYPEQPWSEQIQAETMKQALGFGAIFSSHALKVFNLMGADTSLEGARKVWRWIERERSQSFKKNDCYNSLKGSFPRVADIEPCLDVLEERNYIASYKEKKVGRPSITYTVNPELCQGWS